MDKNRRETEHADADRVKLLRQSAVRPYRRVTLLPSMYFTVYYLFILSMYIAI